MRLRSVISLGALLALPALALAADPGRLQLPDFSALSKIATQSVDISLDPSLLRLASGVISDNAGGNGDAVDGLIRGIRGIYVRSYTFDKPGQYSESDVKAVETQLLAPGWQALVSTHDVKAGNNVDIYIRRTGNRTDGVAIVAANPRQLTIVNIVGAIDLAKLAQLQGQFGVPRIGLSLHGTPQSSAATAPSH